ncbi:MAG TPA: c-type cytochrome, partial [Vicinamibacterales bacterium]
MSMRSAFGFIAIVGLGTGVLLAQQADVVRNPLGNRPEAEASGRRLFDQTCQSCHGPAGQGDRGPGLNTGRFAHGDGDADLFHAIRTGVPGTQMPPFASLADDQIWQLVTYIRSLSGSSVAGSSGFPEGDAKAGEGVFFGKAGCA